jgi:hypothetical protein
MTEQTTVNRTPRASSTRENGARKRAWVRPSRLDTPDAPPGYKHKWIRAEVNGQEDRANVAGRLREGYELVRAEEHPEFVVPSVDDGRHAGVISVGGLLLAKIPEEVAEERNSYYQGVTRDQLEAVDNDMLKVNAHDSMMIQKPERRSRVTFGGSKSSD